MEHFRVVKVIQAQSFPCVLFFTPHYPRSYQVLFQLSADMRWCSTEGVPHCGTLPLGRSEGGMICSCMGLIYIRSTPYVYIIVRIRLFSCCLGQFEYHFCGFLLCFYQRFTLPL